MKLWILGGTTEGRALLAQGLPCVYTAATDYGAELAQAGPHADVRAGRLDLEAMVELIRGESIAAVLDATHPYAVEASRNAREAARRCDVPYVRVLRAATAAPDAVTVASVAAAAAYLADKPGNVLLTTGSKELEPFLCPGLRERTFVRVLPTATVLQRMESLGIEANRIIAMQGPFGRELNVVLLQQTRSRYLVTKDGGQEGGMQEKLDAARAAGVQVVLITRPQEEGIALQDAVALAKRLMNGGEALPRFPLWVDLRGRAAVVVGGGRVARRRVETLQRCGADVTVICPGPLELQGVRHLRRKYQPGDLTGAFLAVAATDDGAVNAAVVAQAKAQGVWVSAADDGEAGTFHFPSLVSEGAAAVSVSSGGVSPGLTRKLSDRLRRVWAQWIREEQE